MGAALATVGLVVSAGCGIGVYGPCYDPDPEWTTAASCDGNVLVVERYRGTAHCMSETTRQDCAQSGQTCATSLYHDGNANDAFCMKACTKDSDCGPNAGCSKYVQSTAGDMACEEYRQLGDPCEKGVANCAPGLVCAPKPQPPADDGGADADAADPCASSWCPPPPTYCLQP